jgi:hypothetical protein
MKPTISHQSPRRQPAAGPRPACALSNHEHVVGAKTRTSYARKAVHVLRVGER